MFMLERNEEAKAYFELSNAIFECEVGANHERTLVTSRNLLKVSRTSLNHIPEYKQLWTTAILDPNPAGPKKKKGKKGKKK